MPVRGLGLGGLLVHDNGGSLVGHNGRSAADGTRRDRCRRRERLETEPRDEDAKGDGVAAVDDGRWVGLRCAYLAKLPAEHWTVRLGLCGCGLFGGTGPGKVQLADWPRTAPFVAINGARAFGLRRHELPKSMCYSELIMERVRFRAFYLPELTFQVAEWLIFPFRVRPREIIRL